LEVIFLPSGCLSEGNIEEKENIVFFAKRKWNLALAVVMAIVLLVPATLVLAGGPGDQEGVYTSDYESDLTVEVGPDCWCLGYAEASTQTWVDVQDITLEGIPTDVGIEEGDTKVFNGTAKVTVNIGANANSFGIEAGDSWEGNANVLNHLDSQLNVYAGGGNWTGVLDPNGSLISSEYVWNEEAAELSWSENYSTGWNEPVWLSSGLFVGGTWTMQVPVQVVVDSAGQYEVLVDGFGYADAYSDMLGYSIFFMEDGMEAGCFHFVSADSWSWEESWLRWLIRVYLLRYESGEITTHIVVYHPQPEDVPADLQDPGYAYQVLRFECAGNHEACADSLDTGHIKLEDYKDSPYPGAAALFDNRSRGCEWYGKWTAEGEFDPDGLGCRLDTTPGKTYHRWFKDPRYNQVLVEGGYYTAPDALAEVIWDAYVELDHEQGVSIERVNEQGMALMLMLEDLGRIPTLEEAKDMVELAVLVAPDTPMQ
jgi:hypothetical protein